NRCAVRWARRPKRCRMASEGGSRWTGSPNRSFFFFQAEDGIRDLIVTGVQTCALPISQSTQKIYLQTLQTEGFKTAVSKERLNRSEERRVGKECRSRSAPYH